MPSSFAMQPLLDPLVEEGEVFLSFVQQRREGVFQQCFRQCRIVREVGERDLRLDHPELGEVAAGVRVLGAEGRPEGINLGQRQAVGLDIELPRDRQERLAAEEILREIDLALLGARQVGEIQGRHPEQCPGPLRVGGGDDRRIDPEKPVLVEEPVDRLCQAVPHARRRADDVGARPQMRDLAQILQGVRLRLDRVGIRVLDPADHAQRARLHLEGLPLRRRRHDHPRRLDRAAGGELQDLALVIGQGVRRDDLHRVEGRPVRQVHERDARLRVPPRTHPSFDRDRRVRRRLAGQDLAPAELSLFHRSRVTQAARACPAVTR